MQQIYFDNSATTQVSQSAAEAAFNAMREVYGNPSSLHSLGVAAAGLLQQARHSLAACLEARAEEIIFTSGGSEANNMALLGIAEARKHQGKRMLLSATEHPSLLEPAKRLAQQGWEIVYAPVDAQGVVDMARLHELLTADTVFVGVHQVNNETGAIQPLTQIGALIRQNAPVAHFHIDGVQALGKQQICLQEWQADSFAASGHKLHAPKGVGLLWLRKGCRLPALILGGGQERGYRSGTENLPGIAAFAAAAREACANRERQLALIRIVKATLAETVLQIEDAALNGAPDEERAAPQVLNVSFPGCRSEVLLHYLEHYGVYVSSGSACSSHKTQASHVLQAMGVEGARLDSAVRFSFSAFNTAQEAAQAGQAVQQAVQNVRAFMNPKKKRG